MVSSFLFPSLQCRYPELSPSSSLPLIPPRLKLYQSPPALALSSNPHLAGASAPGTVENTNSPFCPVGAHAGRVGLARQRWGREPGRAGAGVAAAPAKAAGAGRAWRPARAVAGRGAR